MASRLKGELDVVHVATSDATRPGDHQSVEKLQQLTADAEPAGTRFKTTIPPGPSPASRDGIRSPRS
jgi:hypothetical protein